MKTLFITLPVILVLTLLAGCTPVTTTSPSINETATSSPITETAMSPVGSVTGLEPGWWNDTVFYEIFVRSFKDSDGDGIGDFNGITFMLDYLNDGDPNTNTDLGITGIWLMPIMPSPSYHGYDVADYFKVNNEYGTREDFLHMVNEAHQRGIRVIVDLVLNHTSSQHPWFQASDAGDPLYRDWYIWSDTNPGYTGPWGEQVWYRGQKGYYYAVFWSGMPDLNFNNPFVTQELYKATSFWLTDMDVDGFRLDAIRYYVENRTMQADTKGTHAWLKGFYQFYKSIDPAVFTVGEAWTDAYGAVNYTGDQVDIAFEFDLAGAFVRSANGPIASSASTQLQLALDSFPPGQYGVFLTNHDQDRVMNVLGSDVQKAKLAAVMLLTSPGIPFIYYGEEIGMTGTKPDEDIRRPMQWNGNDPKAGFTTGTPWRAPASDYTATNVAIEDSDPNSLLNLYRALIHLRADHPALRTGETLILNAGTQSLYAILRYDDTEAFLILVNVDHDPMTTNLYRLSTETWPLPAGFTVRTVMGLANSTAPQVNASGGIEGYQPFAEIPAESFTILQLTP